MRLLTPAIKYWVGKSAPGFLYEAMECLGGNGYVEEGILARHYRELPVNAIWEGSGNVMCLDVLRALSREADAALAVLRELAEAKRRDYRAPARPSPSSARRSAVLTASGWRGLRSNGWRCSPPRSAQPGIAAAGRIVRRDPACRRPIPACMARWNWPMATFVLCWNGHCREVHTVRHGRA